MIIILTILINKNNELINTTPRKCIMQKSKLVDKLRFLAEPIYEGNDLTGATVTLEYLLPISHRYCTENLILSPELYEGMLEYVMPFDTQLTTEHGNIELQITFTYVSRDNLGHIKQHVRKVIPTTIKITPIAPWSDMIPDADLTALDQRILKQDAQIKELDELADKLNMTKADNLSYSENMLQLTSNGEKIGSAVSITSSGSSTGDFEIVEF